jgi:competence protein ComEA
MALKKNGAFVIAAAIAVCLTAFFAVQTLRCEACSADGLVLKSKINVNTASLELLMTIDGIGPERAAKIIECRETSKRPFENYKDLQRVHGIGPKTAEKLKDYFEFDK